MKLMCHGMGALVVFGSGEEAKMEEGRGVDHRFELRLFVWKRRSASVFSLDSCVLCSYLLFSIHQFN